ncbi:MAG: RICIN domain-containing protein [Crocinitomicaceae bacterium]
MKTKRILNKTVIVTSGVVLSVLFATSCKKEQLNIPINTTDSGESSIPFSLKAAAEPTTNPVDPEAGKTYFIKSVHSGKFLDVADWSPVHGPDWSDQNGANIQQYTFTGGDNQQWKIHSNAGTGTFRIKSVNSNKVIDVEGFSTAPGGNIQQWNYSQQTNQQFTFHGSASSGYEIKNVGSNKLLDVEGFSTSDGGNIHQWNSTGNNNQKWLFYEVPANYGVFQLEGFGIETTEWCDESNGSKTTNPNVYLEKYQSYTSSGGNEYYAKHGDSYVLKSCPASGKRTEWKLDAAYQFSLSDKRTMSYNATFTDYPSDGVTIAQVHCRGNAQRPLLRVEIRNDSIWAVLTQSYIKEEGTTQEVSLIPYSSGENLFLKLEVKSNSIRVVAEEGDTYNNFTFTKGNGDNQIVDKWFETGVKDNFYFKAGVYNDSGNGTDSPTAAFTYFRYLVQINILGN